ncbi:hypothetical protein [Novosphingobium sp. JCM 18896]|uniref:hypothetical protein n=1 Tax=Novosphingobium sp. JCM 18896 TaxID=2989731 RepID=UPI0022226CDB|nr:hypothetical protein [Novosphingobium sp. JCM 18896]MCW1432204.1 hypothetical protein [Novosphingobium sp. JCM 18896]
MSGKISEKWPVLRWHAILRDRLQAASRLRRPARTLMRISPAEPWHEDRSGSFL